jgi:hypothetical protein
LVGGGGGGGPRPGATAAATAARVAVRAAEAASSLEGGSWRAVRCLSGLGCAAGAGAAVVRGVSVLDASGGAGRRTSNGAAVRVTASAITAAAAAVAAEASASPAVRGGSVVEVRLGDGLIIAEMDSLVLVPSTTLPRWSSHAPSATLSSTADESGSGSAGELQPRSDGPAGVWSSGLLMSHSVVSSASSVSSAGTGQAEPQREPASPSVEGAAFGDGPAGERGLCAGLSGSRPGSLPGLGDTGGSLTLGIFGEGDVGGAGGSGAATDAPLFLIGGSEGTSRWARSSSGVSS